MPVAKKKTTPPSQKDTMTKEQRRDYNARQWNRIVMQNRLSPSDLALVLIDGTPDDYTPDALVLSVRKSDLARRRITKWTKLLIAVALRQSDPVWVADMIAWADDQIK